MADWDGETCTWKNVTVADLAANLVRDLFYERNGEITVDEWNSLWASLEPLGWLYSPATAGSDALGATEWIHRADADDILRRFVDAGIVVIEDEQRFVWPIQKAMAQ